MGAEALLESSSKDLFLNLELYWEFQAVEFQAALMFQEQQKFQMKNPGSGKSSVGV